MSITFPTFIDKEIVTPEKLNDFVQALESKFTAGLGSAEISWPMIAGGDLYLNDYSLIGGAKILGMVNAGAPKYLADFSLALTDGANGCIYIPPNTAITIDGEEFAGTSLTIIGSGPTSVLRLASSASAGWMLRNSTAGCKVRMANLTLDGNGETGAGLQLRGAANVVLDAVWFTDFTGAALTLTDLSGAPCANVGVGLCHFSGGSSNHILMDDCTDVVIADNTFDTAAEVAISGIAADANAEMKRIHVKDNTFDACVKGMVDIRGAGAFGANWKYISITGNTFDPANMASGDIITLGTAGAQLRHILCSGNTVPGAVGNVITCSAQYGVITDNMGRGAGADGLDLLASEDVLVADNNFRDAGAYGIDMSASVDCNVHNNVCDDATTAPVNFSTSNSRRNGNTTEVPEASPTNTYFTETEPLSIPANTLQVGDVVDIMVERRDDAAGTQTLTFQTQSCGAISVSNSTNEVIHVAKLIITAATTASCMYYSYLEGVGAAANANFAAIAGLDLTAAIPITVTGGGATTARAISATITRGVFV